MAHLSKDFFPTTLNRLKDLQVYVPGKPIEEVQREYGLKSVIKLASNENALGPSPKAMKAIIKTLPNMHRYPDGGCYFLRQKLATHLNVSEANLVFGNGSDEALVMALRAFCDSGDQVIIADPTFLVYSIAAKALGVGVVKVPIKQYAYDLQGMLKKINKKTKILFIANPDNPVGKYTSTKHLRSFLAKVPKHVLVVLDEAYYEYAREFRDYPNGLQLLKKHSNLIVVRTFSKAYGLGGLRVGYAVAHRSVVAAMEKVREPFNVNILAQQAALAALEDKEFLNRTLKEARSARAYLTHEMTRLGLSIVPTATNFMLIDLKIDSKQVYEKLLKKGVIVRAMSAWGMPNFIRVTFGTTAENKKFVKALREVLN